MPERDELTSEQEAELDGLLAELADRWRRATAEAAAHTALLVRDTEIRDLERWFRA